MAVKCRLVSPSAMFSASESKTMPSIESIPPSKKEPSIRPLSETISTITTTLSPAASPVSNSVETYGSTCSLQKSIVQQRHQFVSQPRRLLLQQRRPTYQRRSSYGQNHPLTQQIQTHLRSNSQASHQHKKTQSIQLADKLQNAMSDPQLQDSLNGTAVNTNGAQTKDVTETKTEESDYVYTAPCEHHPSKGRTEYLINDMFSKLEHDLSTIEFGIRIADFMPLAFKTVPVAGLAEREVELLQGLRCLPNVIQLEDSFVNDNGYKVLVLPMLKKFDCNVVNKNICSVRKTVKQILTGLAAVHSKNIVHLDINPSNLMVTHTKRDVVIIDFGLSTTIDRKDAKKHKISVCGTTGYIAPEILKPDWYNDYDPTGADIYSLGIVLGEMLEPYIPDCDLHYFGSKYLTVENTNQTISLLNDFIAQATFYPSVLIQAADLLKCMLEENPANRKSAQCLLESHAFLENPGPKATLELCDWVCRVQEIKYQKYLCQEQNDCEVYRYR